MNDIRIDHLLIDDLKKRIAKLSAELASSGKKLNREIAKRRRAEAGLRESREIFYSFMRYQPVLAFMKDRDGHYIYLNEAYKKILNVNPADIIGKRDDELWPPDVAERLRANDKTVMSEGRVLDTVEVVRAGNETRYHLISKFPVFKNGKPFFIGGSAIDITDKVRAEEEIAKLKKSLEETLKKEEKSGKPNPESRIPEILPGLNISEGLQRLDGSWELYLDILLFFCEDKKNFVRDFRELIKKRDFEAAMVNIHSLKGSAATVGATSVRDIAKILEEACRDKNEELIVGLIEPLAEGLMEVTNSCEKIPVSPDMKKNETEHIEIIKDADISYILGLFEKLGKAIQESDPLESESCIKEIKTCFPSENFGTEAGRLFQKLIRQIDNYSFDDAGKILDRLVSEIKSVMRDA
ncbi:PAS domain-containing protein [Desulfococcaceae bacterium HSG8]|nr:PAS domain-containing protein [Desulfococcaceae bacterium HSG8]